jgi:hypothetical protein
MTRISDLHQDVKNVQDTVLGDLEADERVRMFLKAAAEGEDDRTYTVGIEERDGGGCPG